jgi:hypothetical protein
MDMPKCADCRWWQREQTHEGQPPPYDTVARGLRECQSPHVLRGYGWNATDVPLDGALVEDDEGWGIVTGPNFGCVQWEAKP